MSPRPKVALDLARIIEAAADIADMDGIQEVTLTNLAKKLAIRPPSLYNHFDGLTGLRKELAIFGFNELYSDLKEAGRGLSGREAVLALSKAYVNFARRHPGVYEATMLAPDMKDPDVQAAGEKLVNLTIHTLQDYDLDRESALHAVRGLRSILHGFSSLEQKGGFKIGLDLDVSFILIMKAFLAGIGEFKKGQPEV